MKQEGIDIKSQRSALKNLEGQIRSKTDQLQHLKDSLEVDKKAAKQLRESLEQTQNSEPKVSDHAMLRYFERVLGFDLRQIEAEILCEELKKMTDTLGKSGKFPVKDFKVVMKNNTITTITK